MGFAVLQDGWRTPLSPSIGQRCIQTTNPRSRLPIHHDLLHVEKGDGLQSRHKKGTANLYEAVGDLLVALGSLTGLGGLLHHLALGGT
eukprot:CAMPEP_0183532850 /NCGR_PEP_ID=MMETSP0371-20130417/25805_1 /TAXON_ID=268820 /ORGANISM="Peridinium aciculiferum, Strain PAER-2" /LENGTH=87 /DNA_ID=CAMNT_0025733031 /DNA_START=40 /DNA_END=303 /DNA_ORIENTATION=-